MNRTNVGSKQRFHGASFPFAGNDQRGQQNADQLEQDVSMQKQNTSKMDEAQKNIQKILKEKNLVNEDLKGIEIDLNF